LADIEENIRSFYHLIQLGEVDKASQLINQMELIEDSPILSLKISLARQRLYIEVGDYDQTLEDAKICERLAREEGDKILQFHSLTHIIHCNLALAQYSQLKEAVDHAKRVWEGISDRERQQADPLLADYENFKALIAQNSGDFETAMKHYRKALTIREKYDLQRDIGLTYFNIASNYQAMKEMSQAIDYYNRALEIFKKVKYYKGMSIIYNTLKLHFQSIGDNNQSFEYEQLMRALEDKIDINYRLLSSAKEISRLSNELSLANKERIELEQQLWSLRFQLDSSSSDESLTSNQILLLEEEVKNLQQSNTEMANLYSIEQEKFTHLEGKQKELKLELEKEKQKVTKLEKELEDTHKTTDQKEIIENLKMEKLDLEDQLEKERQRSDNLEHKISELEDKVSRLEEEKKKNGEEKAKVASSAKVITELKESLNTEREKITGLETELANLRQKREKDEQVISHEVSEREIVNLQTSYEEKLNELRKKIELEEMNSTKKVDELNMLLEKRNSELESLRLQINNIKESRDSSVELKEEIAKRKEESSAKDEESKKLAEIVEEQKKKIDKLNKKVEELTIAKDQEKKTEQRASPQIFVGRKKKEDLETLLATSKLAEQVYTMLKIEKKIPLKFLSMRLGVSVESCSDEIKKFEQLGAISFEYANGNEDNPTVVLK